MAQTGVSVDPEVLAELAKGRLRTKIPQLQDALAGRFSDHHALLCRAMLARIDQADATVAALGARIDELLVPYGAPVPLLVTIPGVARRSAQVILAEIGAPVGAGPGHSDLGPFHPAGATLKDPDRGGERPRGRPQS